MTFSDLLIEKKYTTYKLSKESGIAVTTLYNIESGKSNILDCRGRILLKLAKTLNVSIEYLLELDQELYNKAYEDNLPTFLVEGIKNLKKARRSNPDYYDIYFDEVNSSINVCEVEHLITKEQANFLRTKYLGFDC